MSEAPSEIQGGGPEPRWGHSLASGSALVVVSMAIGNAGYFAAVLLLARAFPPADRGTVAFVTVAAITAAHLGALGVTQATTVFAAARPAARSALLSNLIAFTVASSCLAAAAVCGGLVILADVRPDGVGTPELILLGTGAVAFAFVEAGAAFLLGCQRFRQRALLMAAGPWLYALALAILWASAGLTVTRALFLWAAAHGMAAIWLLSASLRGIGLGRASASLLRESVGWGLRAWIGSLSGILNFRMDQLIIGFIASEATLGIYAVAVNASEVLLYLPAAVTTALTPMIASSDPALRVERTLRVCRSLVVFTAITVAVAAVVGTPLLPLVFGSNYEDSVLPFLWLLPGAVAFAVGYVFSRVLVEAPGRGSLGPLAALVVGVALDFVLIPAFGAAGAAAAATAAFFAGAAVALGAYRSRFPFAWRQLAPRHGDLVDTRSLARELIRRPGRLARTEQGW